MKALLLNEVNTPLELVDDLVVDKPREHEVLVRTAACGVCHSDLHFRNGTWTTFPLPLVLGHECAGIVEAVGGAGEGKAPPPPPRGRAGFAGPGPGRSLPRLNAGTTKPRA